MYVFGNLIHLSALEVFSYQQSQKANFQNFNLQNYLSDLRSHKSEYLPTETAIFDRRHMNNDHQSNNGYSGCGM